MWNIADAIADYQKNHDPIPKEIQDCGIGLAWSNFFKKNLSSAKREKCFCAELGIDVWYYETGLYGIFFDFVQKYIQDFEDKKNKTHIQQPVLPSISQKKQNRFTGKNLLFTGFFSVDRERIIKWAKINDVSTFNVEKKQGISGKIDFVIAGPNAGWAKLKKATEKNIPVVLVEFFIDEIE